MVGLGWLMVQFNQMSGPIPAELGSLTNLVSLLVNGNMLSGPIPASLANLINLAPVNTNFSYNALYTSDETLIAFLNSKDADWAATQTIAPAQVTATAQDGAAVLVSWIPIAYTGDAGFYAVYGAQVAGGPYTYIGQTANKSASSLQVTGLTPGETYYFAVRSHTNPVLSPTLFNSNHVESEYSNEASAVAWLQLQAQVSGTILAGGSPLAGVVLAGLPEGTVTDANGFYSATVDVPWSGTVTPVLAPYNFSPASRPYSSLTEDQTGQDYSATLPTYTLTYTPGPGGTVTGTSPQIIEHGASGSEVMAVPNTGWHFVDWSDGVLTPARTDTNVTANITVTANFAIDTFTLTYTAGAGGTIEGTSPQTVNYGADGSLVTAVPNIGYHFVDWSDGVLTAARTDLNVMANVNATANFAIDTFTLTYTAGAGGTVEGISPQTVNYGADGTLVTAVPNTGYHFVDWSDGVLTAARTDHECDGQYHGHGQLRDRHVHADLHGRHRRHDRGHLAPDRQLRR